MSHFVPMNSWPFPPPLLKNLKAKVLEVFPNRTSLVTAASWNGRECLLWILETGLIKLSFIAALK